MRAFVVRPFGTKSGIDFERVDKELIQPALAAVEVPGTTTGAILEAGNIREDMFHALLVADLIVADISLHNANVFYELGVRHALTPRRTFLIRARPERPRSERQPEDEVPFDLKTERYLEYDPREPAAACVQLTAALRDTLASDRRDSPVFQLLPDLQAQDRSRFLPVPVGFREDVERAARGRQLGQLGLLGLEARGLSWASEGLRVVGRAQVDAQAYAAARETWEALVALDPADIEANQRLGTIYERQREIDASDQAVQRVLASERATAADRAEALSLLARNLKQRWRLGWAELEGEAAARQAVRSPYLVPAFEKYRQGFHEDLNSFYAGVNALALLTLAVELARRFPDLWEAKLDEPAEAARVLSDLEGQRRLLTGAVWTSLAAARARLTRTGGENRWVDLSLADYRLLTSDRPAHVATAYESALAGAAAFYADSARGQLSLFERLGVLADNVRAALAVFPPPTTPAPTPRPVARVVLFTGHMIDAPGREPPRFPTRCVEGARRAIRAKLTQEIARTQGPVVGLASAASGGDLLFHEVCADLGVESRVLLPLPPDRFRSESVAPAGAEWEARFDRVMQRAGPVPVLARSDDLPRWLAGRVAYTSWQRANLWLIHEALALEAPAVTLLALWDETPGDGPGGTEHMIRIAREHGAATLIVRTADLLAATG